MSAAYNALRERAAIVDLSKRGRILVQGEDRARLLHAMSTNDVANLEPGQQVYAFFLNAQGRILADAYILSRGDTFWLDTEPETADTLYAHLDKYIIADDVTLENGQSSWCCFGLEGPQSFGFFESVQGDLPAESFTAPLASAAEVGVRIWAHSEHRDDLQALFRRAELPEATAQEARTVRIENKKPRFGEEISDRFLVQETRQLQAVHSTKGCYIGQEIVERVRSRGQVHRLLTPVSVQGNTAPEPGTKLRAEGKDSGELVSAVFSPAFKTVVGFAYLRGEALVPNAALEIEVGSITQQAAVRL